MTVSLTDAEGRPVSAFGSNAQWSQGSVTNQQQFSAQPNSLFGANLSARPVTTPAAMTTTTSGNTGNFGFSDPSKTAPVRGVQGGGKGSSMNPVAPPPSISSPGGATGTTGGSASQLGKAITSKWGAQPAAGEQQTPPPAQTPAQQGRQVGTGLYNMAQAAVSRVGQFAHRRHPAGQGSSHPATCSPPAGSPRKRSRTMGKKQSGSKRARESARYEANARPPAPPHYPCTRCSDVLPSVADLSQHFNNAHLGGGH